MTLKTVLLDVENGHVSVEEVENDLDAFYKMLRCDCIDIVVRKIGGRAFDIMCDDEGLLHDSPIISAVDRKGNPALVGNLMFFHHDSEGNLTSLSDDDIEHLGRNAVIIATDNIEGVYIAIGNLDY